MCVASDKNLVLNRDFVWFLGAFFGSWSTLELVTSYGIGKFLKVSDLDVHILTAGMEFGRKATLLRNLVYRSDHPNKAAIIGLIGKIQNESKRNVLAHSFIISNPTTVTFVERSRGGDYKTVRHEFTLEEWAAHVVEFTANCSALEKALEVTQADLHDFAMASFSENTKSTTSPVPPSESA